MSIKYLVIMVASLAAGAGLDPAYEKSVQEYRTKLETSLKSDTGWLTVAGLHWLKPGETTVGSDPKSGFVLPEGKAPAQLGSFRFDGKKVVFQAKGSGVTVNGGPFTEGPIQDDGADKKPDLITVGDLTMTVIDRGGRIGIRLRDKTSKYRKEFTHRSWFPVKAEYNVKGKFLPYPVAKKLRVPTVIDGVVEEHESPGEIEFALNGQTHKAQVLKSGETQLWLIFRDRSSGKATYAACRYLYGELNKDNSVSFDFNKAYNPPCAFTPFATCPLPPRQNSLKVAVEAGELTYHVEP